MQKKIFFLIFVVLLVSIITIVTGFGLLENISNDSWQPVATFSVLDYDPDTGEVGGAVQPGFSAWETGFSGARPTSEWLQHRPSSM